MTEADYFNLSHYQRHNQRRQEHLATLSLPISGKSVLEIGAGIGDHTQFFIDRGCQVTCTDGREELLEILRSRFPKIQNLCWDVEKPPHTQLEAHQITYCYGLLYHTKNPDVVIDSIAKLTNEYLLLETCVSRGDEFNIHLVSEISENPTQALNGIGCRPTRPWILNKLREHFPYVYLTRTQPWHEEFPLFWNMCGIGEPALIRCVFVASRFPLSEEKLSPILLDTQYRC